MDIIYRKFKKDDLKYIEKLIYDEWFKNYKFSERIKKLYTKGYINLYLNKTNYIEVAELDNQLVGFLFGRIKKTSFLKTLKYKINLLIIFFKLLFSKAGRRGIKINKITNKSNNQLKKDSKMKLESELCLFIVNKDIRGNKIGVTLLNNFIEVLKENNIKNNYLFTDTYCDYNYYERLGYNKISKIDVSFNIKGENDKPVYFIFVKDLG